MRRIEKLGPIDPEEIKVVSFDFTEELKGNTAELAEVTSSLPAGEDPDADEMAQGPAVIVGTMVNQRVAGRLNGLTYELKAKVTDNYGLVHIIKCLLPVKA